MSHCNFEPGRPAWSGCLRKIQVLKLQQNHSILCGKGGLSLSQGRRRGLKINPYLIFCQSPPRREVAVKTGVGARKASHQIRCSPVTSPLAGSLREFGGDAEDPRPVTQRPTRLSY